MRWSEAQCPDLTIGDDMTIQVRFGYNWGKLTVKVGSKDWREVNPSTLPNGMRKKYDAYKAARDHANELRKLFEADMLAELGVEAPVRNVSSNAIDFHDLI